MPRPERTTKRPRKRDRSRAAIRAAARAVFERKGYERTTLRDVLDEANVTHPTFYAYFRSTDEVLAELIDELVDDLVATGSAFGPTRSPEPSVRKSYRIGWRLIFAVAQKNRRLLVAVRQAIHASAVHARRWRRFRSSALAIVERDLVWAVAAGIVRCEDPRVLAVVLFSIMETALFELAAGAEKDLSRVESVLESFFWSGLFGWRGAPADYVVGKGRRPKRVR